MKKVISEKKYLLYFLMRWSLFIIIIATFVGLNSKYLIRPEYSNSILMKYEKNTNNIYGKKENIEAYYQSINRVNTANRIIFFQSYIPKDMANNITVINKNMSIIQNTQNKTFVINYTSLNKDGMNKILNVYADTIVNYNDSGYAYKVIKGEIGQIHKVNQTIYKVLYVMIGVFLGIILSILLDIIFCKNKKVTGGRK